MNNLAKTNEPKPTTEAAGHAGIALLGVAAYIGFSGCPIHDGEYYSCMEEIDSLEILKDRVLDGLNESHVEEFLSFDGNEYEIWYESGRHSYTGAKLRINGKTEFVIEDNGSGKLRWRTDA